MNKLFAVALTLLSACTCGGYTGGGDQVLARGSDMLILCDNGGFYATVTNGPTAGVVEGRFATDVAGIATGDRGDTGHPAFTRTWNGDGTATTQAGGASELEGPGIGNGAWTLNGLNQVELDHANIMCTALESRSWWSAQ
ncbi:hypothetical protein BH11MYX1_BH11MYX1_20890 [soil metagenome]